MANIYMSWSELLNKHTTEALEFYYHEFDHRIQIYLIDSGDTFIHYMPTQSALDDPNTVGGNQADLDDWENNHKSEATETQGVND